MKIVRKTLAAAAIGACLAATGAPVLAGTVDLSSSKLSVQAVSAGTFDQMFSFTLTSPGNLTIAANSTGMTINLGALGTYVLPAVTFTGWDFSSAAGPFTSSGSSLSASGNSFTYVEKGLLPGNYLFELWGTTSGSSSLRALNIDLPSVYGIKAAVAAVPEPGEWAMMLAGIGMVGAMIRRRISR